MRRLGRIVAASVLGALAGAAAAVAEVAAGADLPTAQGVLQAEPEAVVRELLDAKTVVLDDGQGELVRAYVLFDRPLDRVYALLSQTARQREYRSDLEGIETVTRLADGQVDEHQIRILFVKVGYRLRYHLDPGRWRIVWELDPGLPSPMRRVEGSWELYPMDESRTLGRLSTSVDVGDALPALLEQAITRSTLPRTLERCRLWVNADGGAP